MADGRKRLSGHENKRLSKLKNEREKNILNKTPKLHTYFKQNPDSNSGEIIDVETQQVEINTIIDNNSEKNVVTEKNFNESENLLPIFFETDPDKWLINEFFRNYVAIHGLHQNLSDDFSYSGRKYNDKTRYLTKQLFQRKMLNGEFALHSWLVYSKSKGVVFCELCRLFENSLNKIQLVTEGYNDWKNANQHFNWHENSQEHKNSIIKLKLRGKELGKIDNSLVLQLQEETINWRNVLKRVVATIKSLTSRGLPLRGNNSIFGSNHNGNYMMSLKLLAQFDSFLADHIARFSNKGCGTTSYLSHSICDEFIQLITKKMKNTII